MKLEKEIYTTKEVAALIGLNPPAIRDAIRYKTLKAEKLNRDYMIKRDDLAAYLEYRERRDHVKY